jgi:hypothetical protein
MKIITFIPIILFAISSFGQSVYKKDADLNKLNNIKESEIYFVDIENLNKKNLIQVNYYDRDGRNIETKGYFPRKKFKMHYKYEYPNDTTQIRISLDQEGSTMEEISWKFDLSEKVVPTLSKPNSKNRKYEYDQNGNVTKIWKLNNDSQKLVTETEYDQNNLVIKQGYFSFKSNGTKEWQVRIYDRDAGGKIIKITTMKGDDVIDIVIYKYKKYST